MTKVNREVLGSIIQQLDNSASTDPTRYHINSVHIQKRGDEWMVESTNGHILARRFFPLDFIESDETDFIIEADCKQVLKAMLAMKKKNGDPFTSVGDYVKENKGIYPDADQVVPRGNDQEWELYFNPDLLANLCAAIKPDGRKEVFARISLAGPDKPFTVSIASEKGTRSMGVLMPGRPGKKCKFLRPSDEVEHLRHILKETLELLKKPDAINQGAHWPEADALQTRIEGVLGMEAQAS